MTPDWQDDAKFPPGVRDRALLACWPEIRKFGSASANKAYTHIMLFATDADFDTWAQACTTVNVKMYTLLSMDFFRGFPALVPMIVSERGDDKKHFTLAVGVGTCETCRLLMCTNYPYGSLRFGLDFRAAVEPATVALTH